MKSKKFLFLSLLCVAFLSGVMFFASGCKKPTLLVNLNSNGAAEYCQIEFQKGKALNLPSPEKDDYLFGGWFADNTTFEKPFNANTAADYIQEKSITIYAKWIKKVNLVFVGTDDPIADIYLNSLDITLPVPEKEGYDFVGWFLDNKTFQQPYQTSTIVKSNEFNEVYLYPKWTVSPSHEKTVYYTASNVVLPKTSDTIEPNGKTNLYVPDIKYYEFCGWFYDSALTRPAPMRISNDMVDSSSIILFGKFVQKKIKEVSILGEPKTHYNYGEAIDLGNAKLFVEYEDEKYEPEVLDITDNMVSGFSSVDPENLMGLSFSFVTGIYPGSSEPIEPCDHTAFFYVNARDCNNVFLASAAVRYYVNSDIKSFSINKDHFAFNFGTYPKLGSEGVELTWEKEDGQTGTTTLTDERGKINYSTQNLVTNFVGDSTFTLSYHFKTIEVPFTVNAVEVLSGYINQEYDVILLGSNRSLLDSKTSIMLRVASLREFQLTGLKPVDVVCDINTSAAGEQTATIMFGGREISLKYYVVDPAKIASANISSYIGAASIPFSVTITLTMDDLTTFDFRVNTDPSSGTENYSFLEELDISSGGEHTAKFFFFGKIIDVSYTIVVPTQS